jgi:hypothetical protein
LIENVSKISRRNWEAVAGCRLDRSWRDQKITELPSDFELFDIADKVLKEFGGLHIGTVKEGVDLAASDIDFHPDSAEGLHDGLEEIEDALGERLYPLATFHRDNYFLLISESGKTYMFQDEVYPLALNFEDALVGILQGRKMNGFSSSPIVPDWKRSLSALNERGLKGVSERGLWKGSLKGVSERGLWKGSSLKGVSPNKRTLCQRGLCQRGLRGVFRGVSPNNRTFRFSLLFSAFDGESNVEWLGLTPFMWEGCVECLIVGTDPFSELWMFNCWDWPLFRDPFSEETALNRAADGENIAVFDNSGRLEDLRERDIDFLKQNRYVNQYGTAQTNSTSTSEGSGDHRVGPQSDGGSDPVVQGRSRASAGTGLVEAGNAILERYRAEGKLTDDEVRAFKGELSKDTPSDPLYHGSDQGSTPGSTVENGPTSANATDGSVQFDSPASEATTKRSSDSQVGEPAVRSPWALDAADNPTIVAASRAEGDNVRKETKNPGMVGSLVQGDQVFTGKSKRGQSRKLN